jgi:hypothetical protein
VKKKFDIQETFGNVEGDRVGVHGAMTLRSRTLKKGLHEPVSYLGHMFQSTNILDAVRPGYIGVDGFVDG